jgi:uncharacterized protein
MLILISPAKTLDFETPAITHVYSQPDFLKQSRQLIKVLGVLSPLELSNLMHISGKLGELNAQRFAHWRTPFTEKNAKQALFTFQGDVYTGMAAQHFSADDIEFAQSHLRILSGLYGVLRPLDLIQAYRLEMSTRLANVRGKNLYEFWASVITDAINQQLAALKSTTLINLASIEYFSALETARLHAQIITPIFKDQKNGQHKIISFFAKKARGMMSAYIIQNRITEVQDIKSFNVAGYSYVERQSNNTQWVFIRDELH